MLCKWLRVLRTTRSEMTGYSFLFLSKNHINYVLKSPVVSFCCLTTPQIHPGLMMEEVWSPEISIYMWFADPTFPESNSKVLLKLCI